MNRHVEDDRISDAVENGPIVLADIKLARDSHKEGSLKLKLSYKSSKCYDAAGARTVRWLVSIYISPCLCLLTFEAVGPAVALCTDAARRVILGEAAPVALAAHLRARVDAVDAGAAQVRWTRGVAAAAHWATPG